MNHWRSREFDRIHQAKRIAKLEKIQTLKALVEMHESSDDPDTDYLRELKARLRSVETQYAAMRP